LANPLEDRLKHLSKPELLALAKELEAYESKMNLKGPQTDDDLHKWILDTFDIDIPRVAVCAGHVAPFTFLADLYFVRTTAALALANRGGAKTFMVAMLHRCNAEFKQNVTSLTGGATEAQSKRCFDHLDGLIRMKGESSIVSKKVTQIVWRNGCKTEIVAGTKAAFNGPHPNIVHVDEQELMDPEAFQESRNCAQTSTRGGVVIPAQNIITSTRKGSVGPMQDLLNAIYDAKQAGTKPPYDLYTWCIFEVAKPNKGCQIADPICGDCECDKISKGEWDDGSTRYLKDVCQGRFAKSSGWIVWNDVVSLFTQNPRSTWEAQQQCSRPVTDNIVLPQFSLERCGIQDFTPDPENGPIYQGIDFGSTNPNAVLWWQVLRFDVAAKGYGGQDIILKEGSRVAFGEFYKAEIPNTVLADTILLKEQIWTQQYPKFRVAGRFADPQGAQARLDLASHTPPIRTTWHTSRDVVDQIKICKELIEDNKFYVDFKQCPMMVEEIGFWHYAKPRAGFINPHPEKPVDDFDHAMSAMRYCLANVAKLEGSRRKGDLPSTVRVNQETQKNLSDIRSRLPGSSAIANTEKWRAGLGSPVGSDPFGR